MKGRGNLKDDRNYGEDSTGIEMSSPSQNNKGNDKNIAKPIGNLMNDMKNVTPLMNRLIGQVENQKNIESKQNLGSSQLPIASLRDNFNENSRSKITKNNIYENVAKDNINDLTEKPYNKIASDMLNKIKNDRPKKDMSKSI